MVFCEWESTFSVGIGEEGPLYRLSVVTDDGVSGGVWTRGEGGVVVPGYSSDKGFYGPPGRIGTVPKLGNIVYDGSYFCVMVT